MLLIGYRIRYQTHSNPVGWLYRIAAFTASMQMKSALFYPDSWN